VRDEIREFVAGLPDRLESDSTPARDKDDRR
jgi:hypothetical protein